MLTFNHAPSCELVLIGSMASNIQGPVQQMDPDNEDDGMDADQAAQRAALAKQRRSHKRTARRKKSLLNQEGESQVFLTYCIIAWFVFVLQSRTFFRVDGCRPPNPYDGPSTPLAQQRATKRRQRRNHLAGIQRAFCLDQGSCNHNYATIPDE